MPYPMRRNLQQMTNVACLRVLEAASSGVLAFNDDEWPYTVPVNFVLSGDSLFIHGAPMGHRSLLAHTTPKVSFCVIGQDRVVANELTSYFKSVVVLGVAHVVTDLEQKMTALMALAKKYSPQYLQKAQDEAQQKLQYVEVVEIKIAHIIGKQAIELLDDQHS